MVRDAYKLYSAMQSNYRKFKNGGVDAKYAHRLFVAAATELMEAGFPNPFDPKRMKVMGVVQKKEEETPDEE